MKTLTLAIMGMTKAGKTTFIQALLDSMVSARGVGYLNDARRTSVPVDYELNLGESEIQMEIQLRYSAVTGGGVEKFNELLASENGAMLSNIGIVPYPYDCAQGKPDPKTLREHIAGCLKKFCDENSNADAIFKTVTTPNLDSYVDRITIRVPAAKKLAEYLKAKGLEKLILRDTRGCLDFSSTKKDGKIEVSQENLTSVGLDNLDAVLFFAPSDNFPNSVLDLHGKLLKTVFESVPIFGIAKSDDRMNAKWSPTIDAYNDAFCYLFELLSGELASEEGTKIDVMEKSSTQNDIEYEFKDPVAAMDRMLHFIPKFDRKTIRSIKSGELDIESKEWIDFQNAALSSIESIVATLLQYRKAVYSLVSESVVEGLLHNADDCKTKFENDMQLYEEGKNCRYFKVGPRSYSHENLNESIYDPTVFNKSPRKGDHTFLGPFDGLTSKRNGKWVCPQTGIGAVAAYEYLWERCNQHDINVPVAVSIEFEKLGLEEKDLINAVRRLLKFLIYRIGTEETVLFSNNWCVRRFYMADALKGVQDDLRCGRRYASPFLEAIESCIRNIAQNCNSIENVDKVFFERKDRR